MLTTIKFGEKIRFFPERQKHRAEKLAGREFSFVSGKANVLVGENGSGKSSLLEATAKKLLAYNFGQTRLDSSLIRMSDEGWTKEDPDYYFSKELFMPDIAIEGAPVYATYMSPDWTPCDSLSWAHALCYGLGKDATDHFKRTEEYSSGQGMSNVIVHIEKLLKNPSPEVDCTDMQYHIRPKDSGSMSDKARTLMALVPPAGSNIVALFDEPERTLDLGSQIAFWKMVRVIAARPHVQVIVASHSIIPHYIDGNHFNFVEMSENYLDKLTAIEEFKK